MPTALQFAEDLSRELYGPNIHLKCDDMTGVALGGNNIHKPEYLDEDVKASGANHPITVGATQPNHARQTATATR